MAATHCLLSESKVVEDQTEQRLQLDHRLDSLILLVYTILIVLSVITIWTFKHRRFRYFHETGLSVVYGLIVGVAFRYGVKPSKLSVEYHDLAHDFSTNTSCGGRLPPQKLIARLPVRDEFGRFNLSMSFQYGYEQVASTEIPFNNKATFNPEIFFNVLLPPIIFCAGYSMNRCHFFRNIGAILTYAFVGTFLSAFVVGIICYGFTRGMATLSTLLSFSDCLLFGSIISATDPVTVLAIFNDLGVDVDLHALVFGESVLNDALAIALSQSVEQYGSKSIGNFDLAAFLSSISSFLAMFSGSFFIGVVIGALTALLTKFTHIREHPLLETTLFVLMSYSTFLLAETIGFTGIVSVLFCGITQAHYTYHNLSNASKLWTKQLFELLNFLSENFVFAYIGVSTFTFEQHYWNAGFVFIAILACIVARAVSVYPLSALINLCRGHRSLCEESRRHPSPSSSSHESCNAPNDILDSTFVSEYTSAGRRTAAQGKRATGHVSTTKISMNMQHMLFFSGLRGAMAFSLAIRNTSSAKRKMFFSTTIVVVMSTVLLCGCLAMSMLNWLRIRTCIDGDQGSDKQTSDTPSAHSCFNRCWSRFDKFYLTPLLTNRGPLLTDSVPRCCSWLAKLVTTTEQLNQTFDNLSVRSQLCEFVNDGDQPGGGSAVLFLQDKEVLNHVSSSKQLDVIALDSDSRQVVGNPLITPANYPDKSSSPHLLSPSDQNVSFLHQRLL